MMVELLDLKLGYWILLTALFVCQPNYSSTKSRVNQRIIGTILGVLVSADSVFHAIHRDQIVDCGCGHDAVFLLSQQ